MLANGRFQNLIRNIKANWQALLFLTLLSGFAAFNWGWLAANEGTLMTVLGFVFQIFFAIAFIVIQFVALFWFLARPRLYWIEPGETGVTFADYKGNDEVLEAARRIVTLLRGVKAFKQMGGETSRGLLLVGPPGTGKSYLAQCIASEAGVPFAYLSAPSIQNMFLGISTLIVMNIFRKARNMARKHGACIIFIDEIDAIAQARSSNMAGGMGGMMGGMMGGGMNLGALNELLMQMDPPNIERGRVNKWLRRLGLRPRRSEMPNVLTIGATNLPEALDKALLRPGRFDRQMTVDLPDYDGRKAIVEYYLGKVKHEPMPIDRLASDTIGYSPVSIKHVINEAVIIAHFDQRESISYRDVSQAREVYEFGLRQPIKSMSAEERRRIAYHEAGHCVAMYLLKPKDPPVKATIIRHGKALGFVADKPLEERFTTTREELLAEIQVYLASRACERLFLGTELNGVTSDLQQATRIAAAYIGIWGMHGSLYSNLAFGQPVPDGRQKEQIERLLDEQYQRVQRLIQEHRGAVEAIAQALLQRSELDRDEISEVMRNVRPVDRPLVAYAPGP